MMSVKKHVYLIAPLRTPIGKFGGILSSLSAGDLGVIAVKGVLDASGLAPSQVDELIFGNARQAGVGPNVARRILHQSGIPDDRPAHTVNKACGSGLQAIVNAAQLIQLEESSRVIAGGTESMSNTPYLIPAARWGQKMGNLELVDGMYRDGFVCSLSGMVMGETAEKLARQYGISRQVQDEYALQSQLRCQRARQNGLFSEEIVPVTVERGGKTIEVATDEHPRDNVTMESLQKLPPVFAKDGTVHAGNASGITDGAAAVLVADQTTLEELNPSFACRIVDSTCVGVDPTIMGIGPVLAVRKLLQRTGVSLEEIDLVELNEAFASQVLACLRDLPIHPERLNVNGGAIALGHPIGCTGTRIVVTLMHEMRRRRARYGLATLCISGGMGMAMLLERCEF